MTLGIGMMIGGGLIAVLGAIMMFTRNGTGALVLGLILAVAGLGCLGVGYSFDQRTEVTYTVTEITDVSVRDDNKQYRITLSGENGGVGTVIYVNDNLLYKFPKDEQVTMTKSEWKSYRNQNT